MKNGLEIDDKGNKFWYLNGKLHREDGPAVEWADGSNDWYHNGNLHRLDGPAAEHSAGVVGWYINGVFLGKDAEGFWELWKKLTPEQQNNLNLHWWIAKYSANV